MTCARQTLLPSALRQVPLGLFLATLAGFGLAAPGFLAPANLLNILVQASSTAIVATGMTFVLLTAGVDLAVGSVMYVAAAVAGKLLLGAGTPVAVVVLAMLAVGALCGFCNALLIARLGIIAFIATLGAQYLERGLGLWITQTRAMNLPDSFAHLASARLLAVPLPLVVFLLVVVVAQLVLSHTPLGRQIYAVGQDAVAARKAGVNVRAVLTTVYVVCGLCAALGGAISLAQIGAVAPTFGWSKEFAAIAAAVLGGTSLFGGRGNVLPGTVLGAVLIQSIENGLVIRNADPYLYPLVTSAIIFLAVLLDSQRNQLLARLGRRRIRPD
jgi:ribose transport system permease protein